MTKIQKQQFFAAACKFIVKKNPYQSTGARLLAPAEELIRWGKEEGLTNHQIGLCLLDMENSPVFDNKNRNAEGGLGWHTLMIYIGQAVREFGIEKRRKNSAWS